MRQKDIMLSGEGNQWYRRNKDKLGKTAKNDPIVRIYSQLGLQPENILEIGCSNGWRLNALENLHAANYFGIDPSRDAIMDGHKQFPEISLLIGTGESLPFRVEKFDLLIYGFCLYLCDRSDMFKIAYEGDRVLADGGVMIIYDFHPPFPYWNEYKHDPRITCYKMNYSEMFAWNPSYTIIHQNLFSHGGMGDLDNPDERISVIILKKNTSYLGNPFIEHK